VANTLRGFACDWLFAMVEMFDWEGDQLTWTNLKPRFQRPVPLDHLTNGPAGLPCQFSKIGGKSTSRYPECASLH